MATLIVGSRTLISQGFLFVWYYSSSHWSRVQWWLDCGIDKVCQLLFVLSPQYTRFFFHFNFSFAKTLMFFTGSSLLENYKIFNWGEYSLSQVWTITLALQKIFLKTMRASWLSGVMDNIVILPILICTFNSFTSSSLESLKFLFSLNLKILA